MDKPLGPNLDSVSRMGGMEMRKAAWGTALGILAWSGLGHAESAKLAPIPAAQKAGFDEIREADLRADLTFIASDALQGRMSLQSGDDAAIQWIAAEFAKAGLQPAATDANGKPSYLQSVPLIEYRANSAANTLTLRRGNAEQSWQAPELIGGYRDDVDLAAPLVFAEGANSHLGEYVIERAFVGQAGRSSRISVVSPSTCSSYRTNPSFAATASEGRLVSLIMQPTRRPGKVASNHAREARAASLAIPCPQVLRAKIQPISGVSSSPFPNPRHEWNTPQMPSTSSVSRARQVKMP